MSGALTHLGIGEPQACPYGFVITKKLMAEQGRPYLRMWGLQHHFSARHGAALERATAADSLEHRLPNSHPSWIMQ
jgi:hypothetical protein